jgi:hypothetical protein
MSGQYPHLPHFLTLNGFNLPLGTVNCGSEGLAFLICDFGYVFLGSPTGIPASAASTKSTYQY